MKHERKQPIGERDENKLLGSKVALLHIVSDMD